MYFCESCSYIYDIGNTSLINDNIDNREILTNFAMVLPLLEKQASLNEYKAEFSESEMLKNKKYQKLSQEDKKKCSVLFEELITLGAEFKCTNCNFRKQITETTLLNQIIISDKINNVKTLEDNKLLCNDPLLPFTTDYTCKNNKCKTHTDKILKKAKFYKNRNSYNINYICCICYYNW